MVASHSRSPRRRPPPSSPSSSLSRRSRAIALVITPRPLSSRILALVLAFAAVALAAVALAAVALAAVALASPFLSPLLSPSSLALCPPYDGAGTPRHVGGWFLTDPTSCRF